MCQVELENSHNVTAVLERGALLNCRVRGIGNRTVSSQSLHLVRPFMYILNDDFKDKIFDSKYCVLPDFQASTV